eukprot:1545161-Amphidinium_carterae.1
MFSNSSVLRNRSSGMGGGRLCEMADKSGGGTHRQRMNAAAVLLKPTTSATQKMRISVSLGKKAKSSFRSVSSTTDSQGKTFGK